MPTVPTLDSFNATAAPLPAARQESVASPALFDASGAQQEQLGKSAETAGTGLANAAYVMKQQADQVRVDDALNTLRQRALNLTYDPQQGYSVKKGADALAADESGQALPDSYASKLQQTADDLSGSLGNPQQQRLFALHSNDVITTFKGSVQNHMLRQYEDYAINTQTGTQKIGTDTAITNWADGSANGPRQQAIDSVKAAIAKQGQLTGESANSTVARMKVAESGIHLGVIDSALQNNNPSYAMAYFAKNKPTMTADDVLKVQGALNRQVDAHVALDAVSTATQTHYPSFAPTDLDRLQGVLAPNVEKGVDPKLLAAPLQEAVSKYGDAAKALAVFAPGGEGDKTAYDRVDAAIKQAEDAKTPAAWLSFLPKKAQEFVTTRMSQFAAGQGAPAIPTKLDFVNTAMGKLPPDLASRPELVKLTREQAERQYDLILTSRKEQGQQMEYKAMQAVIANGGNFAALDPQIKSDLARYDPQTYDRVEKFSRTVGRGDQATNLSAYNAAVTYPEELAKMSDAQFMSFVTTNFGVQDAKHVTELRAKEINGTSKDSADNINGPALNSVLQNRLTAIGIDPKPSHTDRTANERIGAVQKFVRDDIYAQQANLGRKMLPKEIEDRVDVLFAKSIPFQRTFMGIGAGRTDQNMLSMTVDDIPRDTVTQLKDAFAKKGMPKPTNTDLLNAYWRWKNAQ